MKDTFFLCYFETTRTCNLACRSCMSRKASPPGRNELDTDEAKSLVLDELAKVSSNVAVAFSGGEHLLRADAYDLLAHAASLGMWSFVNTNGKLLVETDAVRRSLEATGGKLIFVLPVNSIDAELNRASRDDDISTVTKAADVCQREGAEFFYILTISKENLCTLEKTTKYLRRTQVPMLRAPFVPRGAGAEFRELVFDRDDMRDTIHPALTANPLAYISFTPFFASPEAMEKAWKDNGVRIEGVGCQAGRSFAAVGAEGNVVPCVQLLDSACMDANVRDRPLSETIAQGHVFEALRSRTGLKGKCGRCRYRDTCGGCRSLAYYQTGDILAEDPTCFFEPEDRETRSEIEEEQTAQLRRFVEYVRYNEPWNRLF